mmetsp:Transcript_45850/g.147230  ORF Transcript_45850/g.147230 Transcript_45850/m.147230 type:complete len:445 (-) Transcript_45850:77-1411(-)
MGAKGACNGLISRAEKNKMAAKVKRALAAKQTALGSKAQKIKWPIGCLEGTFKRPFWLPSGWLHGVKVGTSGYTGRGLQVFIAPDRVHKFYHRVDIEKYLGKKLTAKDGVPPTFDELLANAMHRVPVVSLRPQHEVALFRCLSDEERAALPDAKDIHFCVVSARRTDEPQGIKGCMIVQESFKAAGIKPRWYVDAKSLQNYRRLGFDAVADGGSLCGARNKALAEAKKLGKACCQVSDDISRWVYYGALDNIHATKDQDEANRLSRRARRLVISPVAAARFLLARMRASELGPKLGGVLPTGNIARGLAHASVTTHHFILGDFFVSEAQSEVRFDPKLTLKEDYDFTCSHIERHGAVLRCNRMVLDVAHYSNAGGAVSIRNAAEEQKNIKILMTKWPKAIRKHPTRENEVMLAWRIGKRASPKAKASASGKKVLKGGKMKAKRK